MSNRPVIVTQGAKKFSGFHPWACGSRVRSGACRLRRERERKGPKILRLGFLLSTWQSIQSIQSIQSGLPGERPEQALRLVLFAKGPNWRGEADHQASFLKSVDAAQSRFRPPEEPSGSSRPEDTELWGKRRIEEVLKAIMQQCNNAAAICRPMALGC